MGHFVVWDLISTLLKFLQRIPGISSLVHRAQAQVRIYVGSLFLLGCLCFGFFANRMNEARVQEAWNLLHFPSEGLFQAFLGLYHFETLEDLSLQNQVAKVLMFSLNGDHSVWVTEDWNWVVYDFKGADGSEFLLCHRSSQTTLHRSKPRRYESQHRQTFSHSTSIPIRFPEGLKWSFLAKGWEGLEELLSGIKLHPEILQSVVLPQLTPKRQGDPREMIY